MIWSITLTIALTAPLAGAILAGTLGRRGRTTRQLGVIATGATGVAAVGAIALVVASGLRSDGVVGDDLPFGLGLDRPSALLLAVALATAATVSAFSTRSLDDDGRGPRYFASLCLVVAGSALVVVPGSGALLLAGWLVSGWALAGLVGYARDWEPARAAQRRIVRSLVVGDLALLGAVTVAWAQADGFFGGDPAGAIADLRQSTVAGVESLHVVAVLLVLAGASRSALAPFHRWLIGTITAPGPVSALVHAGFVSAAGLLLIRFAPAFAASTPAVTVAFVVALVTVMLAIAAASMRADVKGGLAWSTVGQMAFMVIQASVGAFSSAVFHIAGHGMYKASLFLGAGDTVSSSLREHRRPVAIGTARRATRAMITAAVATAAVAAAVIAIPPDVTDAGLVLIVAFAWISIAAGMWGWLERGPLQSASATVAGAVASFVAAFAYLGGLRLTEWFVKPSLPAESLDTAIGPGTLVVALALTTVVLVAIRFSRHLGLPGLEPAAQHLTHRLATAPAAPRAPRPATTHAAFPSPTPVDETLRARIRAEVVSADDVCGPLWPLASFVAVNPLGGLESIGFEEAARSGRRWLGASTHLSLDEYRADHEDGLTRLGDLERAVIARFSTTVSQPAVVSGDRSLDPVDIIVADLLHGPDHEPTMAPRTALERAEGVDGPLGKHVDAAVSRWLTLIMAPPAWPVAEPDEPLVPLAQRLLPHDPGLARHVTDQATSWLDELDDDPAAVIAASFDIVGIDEETRGDELRGHIARLAGWAGLAKWRKAWAHPTEDLPAFTPIELIAVRAMAEAAVLGRTVDVAPQPPADHRDAELLAARTTAVADALVPGADDAVVTAIGDVLAQVPADVRPSLWLDAQEHRVDQTLLDALDRRAVKATAGRPDAQAVFCIDVRSEGVRRRLEETGHVQTLGFAGFFGVPMAIRKLGWGHEEARCPVLVSPAITAHEHPTPEGVGASAAHLSRQRVAAGVDHAHHAAKATPGSAFVLAETFGWLLGPLAAARTLLPGRSTGPAPAETRMAIDEDEALIDQRVFFAESVLQTMGLVDEFAPLVALCGHTSHTTNNPHATALECGACAGASGADNARAVAELLNAGDVRHGLAERGITIPEDTWFVAGLHDTASDRIALIDTALAPTSHQEPIASLQARLDAAGTARATERAGDLPGPDDRVRDRGVDWAQVRPEWGLARNAAFVIGPRTMTSGVDLDGRAFLHDYDAATDPTGRVLETIMTAPLIVAHWISSQYYFSTVDPERFGAGDKLLHNPIGSLGVVSGDGGDLRVGLPLQSTHVDGRRHHQPVRLMAVIQADIVDIERIIVNNRILRTLTEGSWIRIAARATPDEPWSTRTPDGSWIAAPTGSDLVETPTIDDVRKATT